jgi:hypothetical protein
MRARFLATPRVPTALVGVALALPLTSCFAVADLDRFQTNSADNLDLTFSVTGMNSHVAEMFEFRLVDETNTIQARGVAFPLGGPDATFFLPKVVPVGKTVRLDFFADHNGSKSYDSTDKENKDHSWRLPVSVEGAGKDGVVINFKHDTFFKFLNDGGEPATPGRDGVVRFQNLGSKLGRRLQVRISDATSGRLVALYRYPNLDKAEGTLTLPKMIEQGNPYAVEITLDDEKATGTTLEAWRIPRDGGADGLEVTFDPATADAFRVTSAPRP